MNFGVRPSFKKQRVKKKKEKEKLLKHRQGWKRQGPLCTVRRNVNYCRHYGNEYVNMEVCDNLNDSDLHRLLCLNIWPPVCGMF